MPYYQQAPWRGTWAQDGGTLMNQCIHGIDLLQWHLGGEPDTIMAMTGNYLRDIQAEDFGAILIRFKNGTIGIVEGTACVYPKNLEETLSVFGETGAAVDGRPGCQPNPDLEFCRQARAAGRGSRDSLPAPIRRTCTVAATHLLYADYITRDPKRPRNRSSAGRRASKGMKIILAAYKSQKTGCPLLPMTGWSSRSTDMEDSDVRWKA